MFMAGVRADCQALQGRIARGEGVNLRILDDNVWSYSKDVIPPAWERLGADCRIPARARGFMRLFSDWMPDIYTFQEFSPKIMAYFSVQLERWGYAYAEPQVKEQRAKDGTIIPQDPIKNWTPIFYHKGTLELLRSDYVLYTPKAWSDAGSKSFSCAVFLHKATGKKFAVITTHLWWKDESAVIGSDMARASQACLIMAHVAILEKEFGTLPIFLTGDMNCRESSLAVQTFMTGGFEQCYRIATVAADRHSGHHWCANDGFGENESNLKRTRESHAIDHCLLKNRDGQAEVKRFDCVMDEYILPLTDHYPNIVDAIIL